MKKILSVLSLMALLTTAVPVMAAPQGTMEPSRSGEHAMMHQGRHNAHNHGGNWGAPPPRQHRAGITVGGVLARHSYWNNPYQCNYRLGWYDDFYYDYPYCRPHRPYYSTGIYVRF